MSVPWVVTAHTPNLLPLCDIVLSRFSTNFSKLCTSKRVVFRFHVSQKQDNRAFVVGRNKSSSFRRRRGTWEDPDEGSDSESDEEVEENDLDFESEWEGEKENVATVSSTNEKSQIGENSEDSFIKEVEQLLKPEEMEILRLFPTPNLGKISTEKWNPVHTLGLSGQISSMDKLLDQGIEIDAVDKDGRTALHTAILGNKTSVITHLLRKGAGPHVKDTDGATPLHYAVQVGEMQYVKLLLKYNVDVNVPDNEGWTPLHVAAQTRSKDIVKILLLNGADASRRNEDGNTPLDIGFCYGKDFKSYDLTTVMKVVPGNRDF